MADQVSVRPWGNSQGIRIPKKYLEHLNIAQDDILELNIVNDTIVLKKVFKHKSFKERLAAYDGKISACKYEWGEPKGREMF